MKCQPKPILAIDFDGTIVQDDFPRVGLPMPGAIEAIKELHKMGFRLVLWTCRVGSHLDDACRFLSKHNLTELFEPCNQNCSDLVERFDSDSRKIYADIYIDDKNLGGFLGWKSTLALCRAFMKRRIEDEEAQTKVCN